MVDDTLAVIFSQGFFANVFLVYIQYLYGDERDDVLCIRWLPVSQSVYSVEAGEKGGFQSKYLYIVYMYFCCIADSL